jgi:maltose O-acetyltransferase
MAAALATRLLRLRMLYWKLVYRSYSGSYAVHPTFRFNGAAITLYGGGLIELGERSYIGELSTIQAGAGRTVRIGRCCRISHNVRIYTQTAGADSDFRSGDGELVEGDVSIGHGVWIGANVYVGPGISIGDDAVVGANSVVTHDVPAHEIWGGVPARLIRRKVRAGAVSVQETG